MKKLLILIFIFSLSAGAQQKILQAPFLRGSYSGITFAVTPAQSGLAEECKDYAEYLIANAVGLTADDVEFWRSLPMRGQMKNTIEVDFEIQRQQTVAAAGAVAEIDAANLQDLQVHTQPSSLSEVSLRLGLKIATPELHKSHHGFVLRVKSRDLMCDLLSAKAYLAAKAQVLLSSNEKDSEFLKLFYTDISTATNNIVAANEEPFVTAALLGLAYSEIFRKNGLAVAETRNNLIFLFDTFFKPGSLEPNTISFHQSRNLGLTPIFLKAGIK